MVHFPTDSSDPGPEWKGGGFGFLGLGRWIIAPLAHEAAFDPTESDRRFRSFDCRDSLNGDGFRSPWKPVDQPLADQHIDCYSRDRWGPLRGDGNSPGPIVRWLEDDRTATKPDLQSQTLHFAKDGYHVCS